MKGSECTMEIGLAFFVYKRPEHTQKVIETIKKNCFKRINVFQDGLKNECDKKDWLKVQELIMKWSNMGSENIEIHISDINKGLAISIISGIDYVLERNDAVVALEDDVILSDRYYEYAKRCFIKYYKSSKVMSICGAVASDKVFSDQKYMLQYQESDVVFMPVGSSVAFGTWKDRWMLYRYGKEYAYSVVDNALLCKKIQLNGGNFLLSLLRLVVKQPASIDTWATFWGVTQLLNDGVAVVPIKAVAQDIGRDGSGTNTTQKVTKFYTTLDNEKTEFLLPEPMGIHGDRYLSRRQDIIVRYSNFIADVMLAVLQIRQRMNL